MADDVLKNLYLFKQLTPAELDFIDKIALLCPYESGKKIFAEGEAANALYMVKTGSVEVRQMSDKRGDMLIAVLSAGSHFGEMGFLDNAKRSASAIAAGDTELVQIHYDDLTKLCEKNPALAMKIHRSIAQFLASRLRMTTKKLISAQEIAYMI